MRIVVLGTARAGADPGTVRLVTSLAAAGHEVAFVSSGSVDTRIESAATWTINIDTRRPRRGGKIAGLLRRLNPRWLRLRNATAHITSELGNLRPDLVYAQTRELAALADALGFVVTSDARIELAVSSSLESLAPKRPHLAGFDAVGDPWLNRLFTTPEPDRHKGMHLVLCYHPTDTTPARYLHAALERAGIHVDHRYPSVDLSGISDDVDGVVFVESPYPSLEVTGDTSAPIVFWVHHGEHHLYPNLRLATRYRADGILLAHSWHLAHRFTVPVFPFPFGVPTEMLREPTAFDDRPLEVSMIASGFDGEGERYAVRRRLASQMIERFGADRVRFSGGLSPEEMFAVYAGSKIVIDEGGSRHRPITMRVFEATGSGAALVTDPAPGIELLFEAGRDFLPIDSFGGPMRDSVTEQAAKIALAGHRRALGVHTYDHRVDELIDVLGSLEKRDEAEPVSVSPMRLAVEERAEIDSMACGETMMGAFRDSSYIVWSHQTAMERGAAVDAVVLGPGDDPMVELIALTHRYVFCSTSIAPTVHSMLTDTDRSFTESSTGSIAIFDLATPGYIVRESVT